MTKRATHEELLSRIEELESELDKSKRDFAEYKQKTSFDLNIFRSLMEATPLGVYWKDMNGVYLGCSQTCALDIGKTCPEEVVGCTDDELFSEDIATFFKYTDKEVMNSNSVREAEDFISKISAEKDLLINSKKLAFTNAKGEIAGVLGLYSDISKQNKTELALLDMKNDFKHIYDSLPVGIAVAEDLKFVDVNPKFLEIIGADLDDVIGAGLDVFYVDSEEYYRTCDNNKPLLLQGDIADSEAIWRRKDGTLINVQISSRISRNQNSSKRLLITVLDITHRVKVSKSLLDSEHRFKKVFENLYHGAIILQPIIGDDLDFRCTHINNYALKHSTHLGIMEGRTLKDILKHLPNNRLIKRIEDCYKLKRDDKAGVTHMDYYPSSPWYKVFLVYLPSDEVVILFEDISQEIEAKLFLEEQNEAFQEATRKAEESDKLKTAFLANMSHEIRTPMNGILGFAELLSDDDLSFTEQKGYLDIIRMSGHRMLNTVNDIIDISKIESGQVDINISQFDISKILHYLYDFFKPEAQSKGIDLFCSNKHLTSPMLVKSDIDKVQAIMINLIKNSIKNTIQGKIEFSYKTDGDYITLEVCDTGIGIPENRQKAIFDRFVQVDIEDKEVREGSGLGLAISKAYVDMLGGSLYFESRYGHGTCFYVKLPINNLVEVVKEKVEQKCAITSSSKKSVLVAEDDKTSIALMKIILKRLNINSTFVDNGKSAVDYCLNSNNVCDLVLMDVKMPIMSGLDATRKIRLSHNTVPIIAQTAFGLSGDKEKALEAGCSDYITKPIDSKQLTQLIEKWTS